MAAKTKKKSQKTVQLLIFQDGLVARAFEVPLRWISQLGWYFGGALFVTILTSGMALHFWLKGFRSQPERLRELENQIQVLTEEKSRVEARLELTQKINSTQPAPQPAATDTAPIVQPANCIVPTPTAVAVSAPAPTVTVTVAPSCPPSISPAAPPARALTAPMFQAFPPGITGEIPIVARPSVPIEVTSPAVRWEGRKLSVNFDIRYIGAEGGSQQGRIVVLARGPSTLLGYPDGVLNPTGSPFLMDPEKGEFFSVSRFRQTRVEFPALDSPVQSVEVLLVGVDRVDGRQKVLIRETYKVPSRGGAKRDSSVNASDE